MSYTVPYQHAKRSEGGATEDDWETFPEEPPEAKDWVPDRDGIPAPSGPPSFRSPRYGYAAEESGMDVLRRQARYLNNKRARSMSSASSGMVNPDRLTQSENAQAASPSSLSSSPATATRNEEELQTDGSITPKADSSTQIPTILLSTTTQGGSVREDTTTAMPAATLPPRGRVDSNAPLVGAVGSGSVFNNIIAKTLAAATNDDHDAPNVQNPHERSSSTAPASPALTTAKSSEYVSPHSHKFQGISSNLAKMEVNKDGMLSPQEVIVQEPHHHHSQAAIGGVSVGVDQSRGSYERMMEMRVIKMMEEDMGLETGASTENLLYMSDEKFKNYANSVKSDHYMWYMTNKGALI